DAVPNDAVQDVADQTSYGDTSFINEIDLNKEVIELENELEVDGDDDLPEVANPDNVAQEIREPEEILCKNMSRAREKCGVKGR
nr:hypothetical protein [Tanacetum cinerariifolium]